MQIQVSERRLLRWVVIVAAVELTWNLITAWVR